MADPDKLHKQHDKLFHAAFSSAESAAALIKSLLPGKLAEQIDFTTLQPRSTKLTGPHLEEGHSDFLFTAKLRGREVWLYVLLEHQSVNDPFMVARMLLYVALTVVGYIRDAAKNKAPVSCLPFVLPIVVHHSERGWTAATKFEDVLDPEVLKLEELHRYIPRFEILLDDISKTSDEELLARGLAALQTLALWVLRDARNPERFMSHLASFAELMESLAKDPSGRQALGLLMRYITAVFGEEKTEELRTKLKELAPAAEEAMLTIAEAWEQKGHAKGRTAGHREVIELQLTQKFGPLTESIIARLQTATEEDLVQYIGRILNAERLEEVFES